jgi:hypothetical protein
MCFNVRLHFIRYPLIPLLDRAATTQIEWRKVPILGCPEQNVEEGSRSISKSTSADIH